MHGSDDNDRPLLTLAMIVRNEAATIGRAIASVHGLVDDIVVYDTGSTDDTVAVARRLGAHVVEGTWRDDFAWARNRSLDLVRGTWALLLDADDEMVGTTAEYAALRDLLRTLGDDDVVVLHTRNLAGADGSHHPAVPARRIMRPHLRYHNRVHEIALLPDGTQPADTELAAPWIRHHGYLGDQQARRQRNVRLARMRADETTDPFERTIALIELGRALMQADERSEALVVLERALEIATCDEHAHMARLFAAVTVGPVEGQEAAESWCEPVLAAGGRFAAAARWVLVGECDPETSLRLIEQIDDVDFWHITASRAEVAATRAYLRLACGDAVGASRDLLQCAGAPPHPFAWWSASLTVACGAHDGAGAMIAHLDHSDLATVTTMLTVGPADGALAMVIGLVDRFGPDPVLIEFLTRHSTGTAPDALDAQLFLIELGADLADLPGSAR